MPSRSSVASTRAIRLATVAALFSVACARYQVPGPPRPAAAVQVAASFGRTWDAVITHLTGDFVPIRTIDRTSGLIVTDELTVRLITGRDSTFAASLADCGRLHAPWLPNLALYNIVVRGDSSRASVLVFARFRYARPILFAPPITCSTKGNYERDLHARIKTLAEQRP